MVYLSCYAYDDTQYSDEQTKDASDLTKRYSISQDDEQNQIIDKPGRLAEKIFE